MDIQAIRGCSDAGNLAHPGSSFSSLSSAGGRKGVAGERGNSVACNEAAMAAAVRLYTLTLPVSEEVSESDQELASYSREMPSNSLNTRHASGKEQEDWTSGTSLTFQTKETSLISQNKGTSLTSQTKETDASSKSGLTTRQMRVLQVAFRLQPYCSRQQRCQLADCVGTDEATVTRWFKNARRRVKRLYSRQWYCDNSASLCKFTPESLVQSVPDLGNTLNISS